MTAMADEELLPFERRWDELGGKGREAAAALGWATAASWDGAEHAPCAERRFSQLQLSQQRAALALGYSAESWDAGVATTSDLQQIWQASFGAG